ncbi:MAG: S1/P1 nuclease [bacterium]
MKRIISLLLSVLIFLVPAVSALAWGDDGHQTVGKIASLRIKPRTAEKIAMILKPGETLANISTWADTVKYRIGKTDPDPDTNAFLQDVAHNEKNNEWHYDDLPLGCKNYQTCTGFTPDNDIVHMLNVCIRTLQGHPDPNHPLSQRNALKLLVHFLGDMHQPLHIGCGYVDVNGSSGAILIVSDPVVIKQKSLPSDKGANDLIIDNDRKNLHSFWDFTLVTSLMTTVGPEITSDTLGTFLKSKVKPKASWNPHGALDTWGAQWATDSLYQSRDHTYKSVHIVGKRTIPVLSGGQPVVRDGQTVMQTVFDITRPVNYETLNRELVRQQLAKAGYRLAKLLDAIYGK